MPLVDMKEILSPARKQRYAVGAFEFWSLDSAQAIVNTGQKLGVPVILQAGPLECRYAGKAAYLARIAEMAASDASISVGLHLDHGNSLELVRECIDAGFTSVMIDASHHPFERNVDITREVVDIAKNAGVSVESELGRLEGFEGDRDIDGREAMQTDPEEAKKFVDETGIDALAVAIGTAHGFYEFEPEINIARLKRIADVVELPLVLHGGSGTPKGEITESIKYGISKINICTEFLAQFGEAYSVCQTEKGFKYSVLSLFEPARENSMKLVEEKLRLFSGTALAP